MARIRTVLTLLLLALFAFGGGAVLSQEKKREASQKPKSNQAATGTRTPTLKPLTPVQLFAKGFEYFQDGKLADAEELFREGLKRDGKDYRAWETLARIQVAQNKSEEASRSLAAAVARGLPKEREVRIRHDIELAYSRQHPERAMSCASAEAQMTLKRLGIPQPRVPFEVRYVVHKDSYAAWEVIEQRYKPQGEGFKKTISINDTPTEWSALLAGLVVCRTPGELTRLEVNGAVFPLAAGNHFEIIQYWQAGSERASCDVASVRPASSELVPGHPAKGSLAEVQCSNAGIKAEYFYSDLLNAFLPSPSGTKSYQLKVNAE